MVTTFGAIVDDEELEQQLESLVGTLKVIQSHSLVAHAVHKQPLSCASLAPASM